MKYLFLFDLDNTLFNSASYRKKLFSKIEEICLLEGVVITPEYLQSIYDTQIKKTGVFDPDIFLSAAFQKRSKKLIQMIRNLIFNPSLLQEHFHPDVISAFTELSRFGEIGIFSQGKNSLQRAKIAHVSQWISKNKIHVTSNKISQLQKVFKKYKRYKVFFIDDILPILYEAKQIVPSLITIWIKRGKYAKVQQEITGFQPDETVLNLDDAVKFMRTLIKRHL